MDFNNGAIRIIRKGGNEALIYFGDEVSQALEAYMNGPRKTAEPAAGHEEALFISLNKTRITTRTVERLVKKYSRLVTTVKKITPHKLRSTFGTALYQETGIFILWRIPLDIRMSTPPRNIMQPSMNIDAGWLLMLSNSGKAEFETGC